MATTESAATSEGLSVSIERMTEHDLVEVCQIEELSGLSAWGWDAYHKELQSGDAIMLVAKIDASFSEFEIAGFIVARQIADEFHVNNVAVRTELRGKGIGSALLQTTLAHARRRSARIAQLEVRASNEAAQRLYQRCGFTISGSRRNYYRQPVEDALLMSASLD